MQITPDKWERVKGLFDAVLQQAPADRASFLARVCPEDDLRAQVEELLRNHNEAGSFLSKPILGHDRPSRDQRDRLISGTIIASRFKIVRLLGKGGMGMRCSPPRVWPWPPEARWPPPRIWAQSPPQLKPSKSLGRLPIMDESEGDVDARYAKWEH